MAVHKLLHRNDLIERVALALEHERALQILDDDGVIGARAHLHLALKGAIDEHHEAHQVVLLRVYVDNVGVLEDEPAARVQYLGRLAANLELRELAVVDVVAAALVEVALDVARAELEHERERTHVEQLHDDGMVAKRRIGQQALQVLGERLAALANGRRRDQVVVLGGKEGPVGLGAVGQVGARAAQVGLDDLGERLVRLLDLLVAAHHVPRVLVVRERERVHVRMEDVRTVLALGAHRHADGRARQEDALGRAVRIHVDLELLRLVDLVEQAVVGERQRLERVLLRGGRRYHVADEIRVRYEVLDAAGAHRLATATASDAIRRRVGVHVVAARV